MDPEPTEETQDTLEDAEDVPVAPMETNAEESDRATKPEKEEPEEDWDAEMGFDKEVDAKDTPDVKRTTRDEDEDEEDWDIEMDLGKTGGAKIIPSPPANASSASWHSTMGAVTAASGFTGTITRLGGPKSDIEESWDEFDLGFISSEETPKAGEPGSILVPHTKVAPNLVDWDDEEEEAIATIKASPGQYLRLKPTSSTPPKKPASVAEEEDFEEDFALPDDLSHLSLRPLKHRSSKANLMDGWGDHTSSSTAYSSEASSFGLGPTESPSSSNSPSAFAGPETDDDSESVLDGLVLPEGLFDADKDNPTLHKRIEERKRLAASEVPLVASSPQEDEEDFESGLVIDDDVDFNLSKVKQHRASLSGGRSTRTALSMLSTPPPVSTPPATGRPPSRTQSLVGSPEQPRTPLARPKSPLGRSWSSVVRESTSRPSSPSGFRSPTSASTREMRTSFHSPTRPAGLSSPPPSSFNPTGHISAAREALMRQTSSNSKLSSSTGSSGNIALMDLKRRAIVRKSSLSSIETSTTNTGSSVRMTPSRLASGMDINPLASPPPARSPLSPSGVAAPVPTGRFSTPTTGRANSLQNPPTHPSVFALSSSLSRVQQSPNLVPPTPPGTPSSNPIALRLTMSTSSSRAKPRPSLTSVFPSATISRPTSFAAVLKSPPGSVRGLKSPLSAPATGGNTPPPSSLPSPPPRRPTPAISRSSTLTSVAASIPHPPQAKLLKRPKRLRAYGDGTELDAIEDLPTDRDKEGRFRVVPKGYSSGGKIVRKNSGAEKPETGGDDTNEGSKIVQRRRADLTSARASVSSTATATPTLGRANLSPASSPKATVDQDKRRSIGSLSFKRRPMLIRNLNGPGSAKVVNGMRWNPRTLRWEGNEQVLRDFDNVISSSTRPALITNLTASTMGTPVSSASGGIPGARVVGNMLFDPIKMCWVSQLPPEEEEPDVFADMADDEDDDDWDKNKGGTIRASAPIGVLRAQSPGPRSDVANGKVIVGRVSPEKGGSGVLVVVGSGSGDSNPSPSQASFARSHSESGEDLLDGVVSDELVEQTDRAEERHREEMKGWILEPSSTSPSAPNTIPDGDQDVSHTDLDKSYLHEIRTVATHTGGH